MSVNQRLVNPLTDNLFDIILKLETREECYEFFEDLCTINELHDMSQRLEVARMLRHGEKYDKIEKATLSISLRPVSALTGIPFSRTILIPLLFAGLWLAVIINPPSNP